MGLARLLHLQHCFSVVASHVKDVVHVFALLIGACLGRQTLEVDPRGLLVASANLVQEAEGVLGYLIRGESTSSRHVVVSITEVAHD